jgi:predicted Zn finger-like uncharacterized protein
VKARSTIPLMSLITRCPACGTMFKVVPDQLRISEGWVRCGHCAEVFDASAHMQGEAAMPLRRHRHRTRAPAPVQPAAASLPWSPFPASPRSLNRSLIRNLSLNRRRWCAARFAGRSPLMPAGPAQQASYLDAVDELSRSVPHLTGNAGRWRMCHLCAGAAQGLLAPPAGARAPGLAGRWCCWRRWRLQMAVQERDRIAAAQPALKPCCSNCASRSIAPWARRGRSRPS